MSHSAEQRERAQAGTDDPYFLGAEIIGLSKDELPRPIEEIGPYYDWLDTPRPELLDELQVWLRFWSTSRFTAKTYGFLVWALCKILRNRNIRIIIQGEEKQMAMESVMLMREWMEEPAFVSLYGRMESKLWLKDQLTVSQRTKARKDPTLRALGLDVPMQGKRCDINLWDDLVGDTNYESEEGLRKVEKRVQATMPLIVPGGMGLYICTRWSPYDLSTDATTMSGQPGIIKIWKDHKDPKTYPTWDCAGKNGYFGAYAQDGDDDFYAHAVEGEPLYPTVLNEGEIARKRITMQAEFFASQVLNNPIPAGTEYFSQDNLQHFNPVEEDGSRSERLVGLLPFMAVDPASGKKKAAGKVRDATTMCVGFIGWQENTPIGFVVDWIGGVWKPTEIQDRFFNLVDKWKPRKIWVETNIGGEHVIDPLKRRAQDLGLFLPIIDNPSSLHGTGKKPVRIGALQEFYSYRQIWHAEHLKNCPGEQEMLRWKPIGALHDDWVDVLAQWWLTGIKKRYAPAYGNQNDRRLSGFSQKARYKHTGM
jgi:hypothetical protein